MNRAKIGKLICRLISSNTLDKTLISILNKFDNLDWNDVYIFTEKTNLLPIFFYKLRSFSKIITVPTDIELKMQNAYIASSGQSLKIEHQLKEILSTLNKEAIDVIILKGAYLANKYYEHPGLRPMCDIDILVSKIIFKLHTSL